jgi:hypothetical protein
MSEYITKWFDVDNGNIIQSNIPKSFTKHISEFLSNSDNIAYKLHSILTTKYCAYSTEYHILFERKILNQIESKSV